MILLECAVWDSKKSRFIKEREASRLSSSLGLRTPFIKIFLSGDILFERYKMNEVLDNFLLAGDKLMSGMHLRQRGFTCSAWESFTKNKKKIEKLKETGDSIKFENQKVHLSFKDNIWGSDLADMQLISKCIKGFCFLLCVIYIYGKYAWVAPLKDKKGIIITHAFQNILDEYNRKPIKIWVNKGSELYIRSMKSWSQDNYIEM